jgi:hypothetical protein
MVLCYYTPTLPAMIISPNDMGHQLSCHSYTSISNFDGIDCQLCLHHCNQVFEDVITPLTLNHGLMYSDPLIPPTTDTDHSSPMPPPVLHVECISHSPSPYNAAIASISLDTTVPMHNCCSACK